jgi:CDP-glycerol glycerophosphotransferase
MNIIYKTLKKIKHFSIDVRDSLILCLLIPFGMLLRLFIKDVWLVSERLDEARDNGYWFFKYIHENNLHKNTYYIIREDSSDRKKLVSIALERIINYGSFKHYLFYIIGKVHISSQVHGCMFDYRIPMLLERCRLINNHKVFLQHGITKDFLLWLFRHIARIDLFCCAAEKELNYIKNHLGYKDHHLALTGFCRYDSLKNLKIKKQILLSPTWRQYLGCYDEESFIKFRKSQYYRIYNELLNNDYLLTLLNNHCYHLIFYLHSDMQHYINEFKSTSPWVVIARKNDYDFQTILKDSALLITDYSSVFFDFAYMNKPCIYYQFDYEEFRRAHYKEGYFNYQKDAFGPVVKTEKDLIEKIEIYLRNHCVIEDKYKKMIRKFFAFNDQDNCKRTFEKIMDL